MVNRYSSYKDKGVVMVKKKKTSFLLSEKLFSLHLQLAIEKSAVMLLYCIETLKVNE